MNGGTVTLGGVQTDGDAILPSLGFRCCKDP